MGNTETTTQAANIQARIRYRSLILIPSVLAGLVLIASMKRLPDALSFRPLIAVTERVAEQDSMDLQYLESLLQQSSDAINKARVAGAYGYVSMLLAERFGIHTEKAYPYLQVAQEALKTQLLNKPTDSYSWIRLARVNSALGMPIQSVFSAWAMSVKTAPYEPKLLRWRVKAMLPYQEALNDQQQQLLARQVKNAWLYEPEETITLLKRQESLEMLLDQLSNEEKKSMHLSDISP